MSATLHTFTQRDNRERLQVAAMPSPEHLPPRTYIVTAPLTVGYCADCNAVVGYGEQRLNHVAAGHHIRPTLNEMNGGTHYNAIV